MKSLVGRAGRAALVRARQPVRRSWQSWVRDRGTDVTVASEKRRTIVVAPHPDDETIGCGATIARKRAAGTDVEVLVVTDGRHSHQSELVRPTELAEHRISESIAACRVLGLDSGQVHNLGFEEATLWRSMGAVVDELGRAIDRFEPDEILVVSDRDWHDDHKATHLALVRAAAARRFDLLRIGAYPVWHWADGPWETLPSLTTDGAKDIVRGPWNAWRAAPPSLVSTEGFAATKREAFLQYRSQVASLTGDQSWATFAPDWIDQFLEPSEVFYPIDRKSLAKARRLSDGVPTPLPPLPVALSSWLTTEPQAPGRAQADGSVVLETDGSPLRAVRIDIEAGTKFAARGSVLVEIEGLPQLSIEADRVVFGDRSVRASIVSTARHGIALLDRSQGVEVWVNDENLLCRINGLRLPEGAAKIRAVFRSPATGQVLRIEAHPRTD